MFDAIARDSWSNQGYVNLRYQQCENGLRGTTRGVNPFRRVRRGKMFGRFEAPAVTPKALDST